MGYHIELLLVSSKKKNSDHIWIKGQSLSVDRDRVHTGGLEERDMLTPNVKLPIAAKTNHELAAYALPG